MDNQDKINKLIVDNDLFDVIIKLSGFEFPAITRVNIELCRCYLRLFSVEDLRREASIETIDARLWDFYCKNPGHSIVISYARLKIEKDMGI